MESESRKIERTPEEQARIKAIREKFQREKPSLKKLVESGDAARPISLGTFLDRRGVREDVQLILA